MAYFPNGTSGEMYAEQYCLRCVNHRDDGNGVGCPIMDLHMMWNYDAVGEGADETKKSALDFFIPTSEDGLSSEQCRMFVQKEPKP